MYSIEDKDLIEHYKAEPPNTPETKSEVTELYKKYVNTGFTGTYIDGCSCSNGISTIYHALINWYDANISLFADE